MLINSPNISGSLTVTGNTVISGSLNVAGGINATITGSATSASYVEYSNVANKPTLVSGSSQVTYSGLTGVPSGIVSGSAQVAGFGIFATTGSNQFNGAQAVTGSLTVTGQVVAQTLNVQQVTSSIVYSSGSNIFGNSLGNTQQFTGSVSVTGSLTVTTNGTELQVTSTGVNLGNALTDSHIISGSLRVNPNGLFISGSGNVGIGSNSPNEKLEVQDGYISTYHNANVNDAGYGIQFYTNGGGSKNSLAYIGLSQVGTARSGNLLFQTSDAGAPSTKMTITSTGNVGIGTSNPSATLDIGSGKNLSGTDPISVYTDVRVASAVTGGLIGYNLRMVALAGSYTVANMYGIKTNTAVVQSGVTVTNSYGIYIGRTDDPTSGGIVTNKYALVTEATAGNVGIGTTTPYSKLEVYTTLGASMGVNHAPDSATYPKASGIGLGATSTSYTVASGGGTISFVGGAGMYAENTALSGNPTNLVFWTNLAGTPAERMRITSDGIIQVSTTTSVPTTNNSIYSYSANGLLYIQGGSVGLGLAGSGDRNNAIYINSSLNQTTFVTNNSERMRITSGGQVLIGQTSASGNTNGMYFRPGIESGFIVTSDVALQLSRLSTTGDIQTFYSDTTRVGKIAVGSSTVTFESATNGGLSIASTGRIGVGESASTNSRLNVNGSTKINRSVYNWYQAGWQGNGTYWHMKTNMSAGGAGNIQYTMSLFKGYMYSYSDPSVREGAYGFHNWSGVIYNAASTGNLFTTVYISSDGFVVLVIPSGNGETGVTIDWHQAFGYPFVEAIVTNAKLHGSTTGGY
jgi:hypothetical protein